MIHFEANADIIFNTPEFFCIRDPVSSIFFSEPLGHFMIILKKFSIKNQICCIINCTNNSFALLIHHSPHNTNLLRNMHAATQEHDSRTRSGCSRQNPSPKIDGTCILSLCVRHIIQLIFYAYNRTWISK